MGPEYALELSLKLAEKRAEKAETERDAWRDAALAWRDMNACFRTGRTPSEALFKRLDRARELVLAKDGT